jgi:hypothetical protein
MDIESEQANYFRPEHLHLLTLTASRIAQAIENARLYARVSRQAQTLEVLNEIAVELTSILDLDPCSSASASSSAASSTTRCSPSCSSTRRAKTLITRYAWRFGYTPRPMRRISINSGLVGAAVREWRPINVPDVRKDPRYLPMNPETRSELIVPLFYKGRVIGVLDLEHTRTGFFNEEHERMLTTLAAQVAISIENARLYQAVRRQEAQLERDIAMAREVQLRLLPRPRPRTPRRNGRPLSSRPHHRRRPLRLHRLRPQPHRHRPRRRQRQSRAGRPLRRPRQRHHALRRRPAARARANAAQPQRRPPGAQARLAIRHPALRPLERRKPDPPGRQLRRRPAHLLPRRPVRHRPRRRLPPRHVSRRHLRGIQRRHPARRRHRLRLRRHSRRRKRPGRDVRRRAPIQPALRPPRLQMPPPRKSPTPSSPTSPASRAATTASTTKPSSSCELQLLICELLLIGFAVLLACPSSRGQELHPAPNPKRLVPTNHPAVAQSNIAAKTLANHARAAVIDKLLANENLAHIGTPMTPSATVAGGAPRLPSATGTPAPVHSTPGSPSQPLSLFDALANHFTPLSTTIEVRGVERELETSEPEPYDAGGQEVISTAGAWGDISRFLQVLPGVVATSDLSNEILVRGGHPMENLFLVDGIEIPNINHLATLGTTGGFGPMIDAGIVQGIKLYTGGYDARYPERLSSVTEIRTLDSASRAGHAEGDVGIEGFGGLAERSLGGGDLLVSAHHGIMNLMGNSFQMGMGGLPSYTNGLARYRRDDASGNRLTVLQVAGWDSIQVTPCASDTAETSSIDSQYSGWRETTGVELQRVYSPHSFGVASVSDSEQIEHIHQQDQIVNPMGVIPVTIPCPIPAAEAVAIPVYAEDSDNAFSSASYRYELATSRIALSAGSAIWLQRPDYQIAQPIGAYSPYSAAPVRADSTSFASDFSTGETGSYAQTSMHPLKALELGIGGRLQTFAFGNHTTITPRLSCAYSFGEWMGIHAHTLSYAQMPPPCTCCRIPRTGRCFRCNRNP